MKPSRIIASGGEPYLLRWYVIPRNRFFNIYLHHILKSDDERALHDHPWWSVSFKLKGPLEEVYLDTHGFYQARAIPTLWPVFRSSTFAHRLILEGGATAWTIFVTGPRLRSWGFLCPNGWKHWRAYDGDGGCGEI